MTTFSNINQTTTMGDIELESRVQNINLRLPPDKQLTVVYPEGYDSDRIWIVK
jgi:hypothetical protein